MFWPRQVQSHLNSFLRWLIDGLRVRITEPRSVYGVGMVCWMLTVRFELVIAGVRQSPQNALTWLYC